MNTSATKTAGQTPPPAAKPGKPTRTLLSLLKPYRGWIVLLVLFAVVSNAFNLAIPLLISHGIDAYTAGAFDYSTMIVQFFCTALAIFVFAYLQSVVQTYASELVGRDLRKETSGKISRQSYAFVQSATPSKLLTNLTSDVDAVKLFVSQAVVTIVSSLFLIVGASILLLLLNWKLALAVLAILPIISATFFVIFSKVRTLFKKSQEVIDRLNKVINESIFGSALIRVLNSQQYEYEKFLASNTDAKNLGLQILKLFASLIPVVTFISNMAALTILVLGGHFVIAGSMTLGEFGAFNSYLAILIFPIIMIGFMSTVIARATASYNRILEVILSEERKELGTDTSVLKGDIEVRNVSVVFGEKSALKNVSFSVKAGTKAAVIGPTGAGKTQLIHLLTGLMPPTSGTVLFDGKPLDEYDMASFHRQVGLVFEDSVIFNMSLRENIAFGDTVREDDMRKAMETAELQDFVDALPKKLDTVVSERGTSLSGGQKQRIMLARALALNPKILLLDDFTARVDTQTEQKILANVARNYPDITLVSITQKIASVENFDQVILLMEGELLAQGTHAHLMKTSPEYVQIAQSQRSTTSHR
ncbi:MAG TPA: ABC transporter ATP-binding protein [Candidatus Peribacteria bacterium]|nr:ABC transporter ATP-binding protein [Candidatus Peribacteria bacterium]